MPTNYFVSYHGRGASYGYLIAADSEEDLTARCQAGVNSGFEVYIYKIEQSPLGRNGFDPEGSTNLRRVFHLYDARDEYEQQAKDIIDGLSRHSWQASADYLDVFIRTLSEERTKLDKVRSEG
jgi:hypothetical protein